MNGTVTDLNGRPLPGGKGDGERDDEWDSDGPKWPAPAR